MVDLIYLYNVLMLVALFVGFAHALMLVLKSYTI